LRIFLAGVRGVRRKKVTDTIGRYVQFTLKFVYNNQCQQIKKTAANFPLYLIQIQLNCIKKHTVPIFNLLTLYTCIIIDKYIEII
jgi:hypothetical protein